MEDYEELKRMVAEFIVWARGEVICPFHQHVDMFYMSNEGPVQWHGPVCMMPPEEQRAVYGKRVECEFNLRRDELVDKACELMGSRDMSQYL